MGFELFRAKSAAEVIPFPRMLVDMLGGGGVHTHPANGVVLEGGSRIRSRHVRNRKCARKLVCFDCRCSILDSSGGLAGHFQHHSEGFEPMTYLDVVFRYGAVPGENEM